MTFISRDHPSGRRSRAGLPDEEPSRRARERAGGSLFEEAESIEFLPLKSSVTVPATSALADVSGLDRASLRKRLFAPAWWCEGILTKHGAKEPLVASFAARRTGRMSVVGPAFTPKRFALLYQVWNELVSQVVAGQSERTLVRVPLAALLRGTSVDIAEAVHFLETYWSSPFEVVGPRAGTRRAKGGARSGVVNFVRYCTVEHASGPTLVLELALPLADFVGGRFEAVLPSFLCEEVFSAKGEGRHAAHTTLVTPGVVSANPDVLRAFGSGNSPKKIVSYLAIEFCKVHAGSSSDAWRGLALAARDLEDLHEGLLQRTTALYDHGVFGWENAAPRVRVRDLRGEGASIVHCWRLSQQAAHAAELECALRETLSTPRLEGGRAGAWARLDSRDVQSARDSRDGAGVDSRVGANAEVFALRPGQPRLRPSAETHATREPEPRGVSPEVLPGPGESFEVPSRVAPSVEKRPASATQVRPVPGLRPGGPAPRVVAPVTAVPVETPVRGGGQTPAHGETPVPSSAARLVETPVPRAVASGKPPSSATGLDLRLGDHGQDAQLFLCVLEYYSSLTPRQQRLFQTQKSRMTDEEFRDYVLPLLAKRKG